jgi:hypothetical protein
MFTKVLSALYKIPYAFLMAVRANPIGVFIYSIFMKWYFVFTIASIMVLYWVIKGLESTGIIEASFNVLVDALYSSKAIAQNCTPKILNITEFWNCLSDPGIYKDAPGEQELNDVANKLQNIIDSNSVNKPLKQVNPYSVN